MASILDQLQGVQPSPALPPQQPPLPGSTGYLHPILLAFLQSLPNANSVIQAHPAFPILRQTHPTAFQAPSAQAITSPSGLAAQFTAPRSQSTISSGQQIGRSATGAPGDYGLPPAPTPPIGASPTGNSLNIDPFNTIRPNLTPTPGVPMPFNPASSIQPPVMGGPNATPPIGNSGIASPQPNTATGFTAGAPGTVSTPRPPGLGGPPASAATTAQQQSGVIPGPLALNHVPYGPELTGLSGFGGLITPNGTPVAMSNWQKLQLDPTSVARYNSYLSDVAGMNPADLAQIGANETGNRMNDLKAPIKFAGIDITPAPAGG